MPERRSSDGYVLRADAAPDPEVVGVADDQLGPKRQPLFEVLLEPRGFVVAVQRRIDPAGQNARPEHPWGPTIDRSAEDDRDLIRSADVEMIANDSFEPQPTGLRPVKHASVRHFKLAEGQRVYVTGAKIGRRERRRQPMHPAPEKTLDGLGAEPLANLLQGGGILTRPEAVIQCLVPNARMLKLPLGPFVSVEPQPDRERRVRVRLPKRSAPLRIPQVKVKVVHERHLSAPIHVRVRSFLLPLPRPRCPSRRLFLADADQDYSVLSLACRGFKIGPCDRLLVLPLLELHDWNLVLLGETVDRFHIRVTNLAECRR